MIIKDEIKETGVRPTFLVQFWYIRILKVNVENKFSL